MQLGFFPKPRLGDALVGCKELITCSARLRFCIRVDASATAC